MSEHIPSAQHPADKAFRSNATSLPFWQQLRWNLIFYFILLAILPVISVTGVILVRTSAQATNQVYDQLDSVAELKQDQILRWLNEGKLVMDTFLSDLNQNRLAVFAASKSLDSREQTEVNELLVAVVNSRYFARIFIYNTGGRVIASSDPADVGKDVSGQPYFEVSLYANYTQPPLAEPATGQMVMYMTRPLRIGKSDATGVLAGQFAIDELADIMTKRVGLGESGETYLVSLENNHMWTPSRFAGYEMTRPYHSQGIDNALGGIKGRSAYDNYRTPAVPVFGSYRFVPEMRAGLLAEVEQSQAVGPYRQAQLLGIATAVVATLIAMVVGFWVAQQVSKPITALTKTASRIMGGDLSTRSAVKSRNEVGMLASAFNAMTDQLQDMIGGLEQRVAERTVELREATGNLVTRSGELEKLNLDLRSTSQQAERRATQLAASAQVAHAASQVRDLDQLLSQVTQLISQAFGYYHVGVFIVDEAGRFAVLRATNSEGGQRMLMRGHKLAVGKEGIVGYVTGTGQPRIALDVGADAVHFDNPDLPQSRSEMALPLRVGDQTFGALDVQSTQGGAFAQEDVAVLGTLADQIAIAIENARLFTQTQAALQEAEETQRRYIHQEWEKLSSVLQTASHEYRASGVPPVGDAPLPEIEEAIRQGRAVTRVGEDGLSARAALAMPIKLRDQLIGVIDLQETDAERQWTDDDVALVTAVADQVALALENVRLFDQTRQRAQREQLISQVTAKMRAAPDIEGVLRTTVREIRRALGASQGVVRLRASAAESAPGADQATSRTEKNS